jgi:hypothetical protein
MVFWEASANFIPIEDIEEARPEHSFAGTRSWCQCRWLYQLSVSLTVPRLTSMLRISSDNAIYDFCKKAVENGLDIFRVFDSLNYIGM